jgi:hypothetical protein
MPIIPYLDATQLSNNNKHSIKPVKIALGNHTVQALNQPGAKKVS